MAQRRWGCLAQLLVLGFVSLPWSGAQLFSERIKDRRETSLWRRNLGLDNSVGIHSSSRHLLAQPVNIPKEISDEEYSEPDIALRSKSGNFVHLLHVALRLLISCIVFLLDRPH